MKVILAFIVIIILIGLGGVYKFSGKSHSEKDEEAAQALVQSVEAFTNKAIAENVRDQEAPAESDVSFEVQGEELCVHTRADFSCYEEFFQESVQKEGIPAAFASLRKAYQGNDYVRAQCHPLTHVIGRTAAGMFSSVGEWRILL